MGADTISLGLLTSDVAVSTSGVGPVPRSGRGGVCFGVSDRLELVADDVAVDFGAGRKPSHATATTPMTSTPTPPNRIPDLPRAGFGMR